MFIFTTLSEDLYTVFGYKQPDKEKCELSWMSTQGRKLYKTKQGNMGNEYVFKN
jgi:hypothetical protein